MASQASTSLNMFAHVLTEAMSNGEGHGYYDPNAVVPGTDETQFYTSSTLELPVHGTLPMIQRSSQAANFQMVNRQRMKINLNTLASATRHRPRYIT
jgi:hypothetical protein